MPGPMDKLRRVPPKTPANDKSPLPDNELTTGTAPAEGDANDELPEGASPLPADCGPMPLPGRDQAEEPEEQGSGE